jgi:hypothetical protein
MMNRIILLAVIWFAYPVFGQEVKHAAVTELCRADQSLWEAQLAKPSSSWAHAANDVDSRALVLWASEMNDCARVDKDRNQTYTNTVHWIFAVLFNRESDFLTRHKLLEQFYQEDAEGAR